MAIAGDPVKAGVVGSLASHGGNVTGLTLMQTELSRKRLQLLREAAPGTALVAVIWNPTDPSAADFLRETEAAARSLGLKLHAIEARSPADLDAAFRAVVDLDRRAFVAGAVSVLVAALAAGAQARATVAFLCAQSCSNLPDITLASDRAFLQSLAATGLVAGRDVAFDTSGAGVGAGGLPRAAERLVQRKVDVIVAFGNAAARAARRATATLPIVMVNVTNPAEEGLIGNLARPGGNVTGLAVPLGQLNAKQIELLKDIQPALARVAVLWDPTIDPGKARLAGIEAAGRQLGVGISALPIASLRDLEQAWTALKEGADGILVLESLLDSRLATRGDVALFALKHRLPTIASDRALVTAGGLMAYGPDLSDLSERAGTYVGAILRGRKPAQLPVQEPQQFKLVVSKTTAKALGLTIPPAVLARADEIIE